MTPDTLASIDELAFSFGTHVDALKFAGGSFTLMPERTLHEIIETAHEVLVSTGGAEVNLFVDHSQIVQLECLRRGIWGTKSLWDRVVSYPES